LAISTVYGIATVYGISFYDSHTEATDGIPVTVTDPKDALAASIPLLIATPEHNNSVPGAPKNAVDWLTRPAADLK
jgi:NAD(P)H-dependent FMN reductase